MADNASHYSADETQCLNHVIPDTYNTKNTQDVDDDMDDREVKSLTYRDNKGDASSDNYSGTAREHEKRTEWLWEHQPELDNATIEDQDKQDDNEQLAEKVVSDNDRERACKLEKY